MPEKYLDSQPYPWPWNGDLRPQNTALIVIDMQTDFCGKGGYIEALGYDINTVEFAIRDGVPYAIDFMNPAPDAELASVGEFYHNGIANAVVQLLQSARASSRLRRSSVMNPSDQTTNM